MGAVLDWALWEGDYVVGASGATKDERDMLGRWKPEGSDQYVRTYNMAVSKMQQKMAEVIKFGNPYE